MDDRAQIVAATDRLVARQQLGPEEIGHLSRLYGLIWSEAVYDPSNEATGKFAERLLPHIQALNKRWKFKQ